MKRLLGPLLVLIATANGCRAREADDGTERLKWECNEDPSRCSAWRDALERGCRAKKPDSCGKLASLLALGTGGLAEVRRGRFLAKKSCADGSAFGCTNYAYFAMNGKGGPVDLPAALVAADAACRMGAHDGCNNLSVVLHKPEFELGASARREGLILSCEGYADRSCKTLADELHPRYQRGELPREQHSMYRELSLRLCHLAYPVSCQTIAQMAHAGEGGPRDAELMRRASRRACKLGRTDLCAPGEAARAPLFAFWAVDVEASDGGDHLDRVTALEEAWQACRLVVPHREQAKVELTLLPGKPPRLTVRSVTAIVRCFEDNVPWGDHDPWPVDEKVVLELEYDVARPAE